MLHRFAVALVALALLGASCAYESSGTTTTTVVDPANVPPATGPADLVLEDQRVEGTSLTVASVTMPDDGWVVVRVDQGGGPGEIIGISELLRKGVIARVAIPFSLPITGDTRVFASIHIDMDRDTVFTYEPPDSFIDEIGTFASGSAATTSALIELLPPIQPGEATLNEQRTDGRTVIGAAAVLPAPGFVALMSNRQGEPGDVLAATGLLPAGTVSDIELLPEPPLRVSGLVFLVAWVDRDEDGLLDPDKDDIAVRADGTLAAASGVMTVVPLEPASISAVDQSGDGITVAIAEVIFPGPGFVEVLADDNGSPGRRLAITEGRVEGTYQDLTVELDETLPGEADAEVVLWVRPVIDFDEDGAFTDADPVGLSAAGGPPAQASFTYTIAGS